jgi:hypothetical protein
MTRFDVAPLALAALLAFAVPALAQGVFVPTPGSAPTVVGPGSTNPSAAASAGGAATNPSAAASSVSTPGALNPSGTSSSFAPTISSGGGNRVLTRPLPVTRAIARQRTRARPPTRAQARAAARARHAQKGGTTTRGGKAVLLPPAATKASDERAKRITGSVCTGC